MVTCVLFQEACVLSAKADNQHKNNRKQIRGQTLSYAPAVDHSVFLIKSSQGEPGF